MFAISRGVHACFSLTAQIAHRHRLHPGLSVGEPDKILARSGEMGTSLLLMSCCKKESSKSTNPGYRLADKSTSLSIYAVCSGRKKA